MMWALFAIVSIANNVLAAVDSSAENVAVGANRCQHSRVLVSGGCEDAFEPGTGLAVVDGDYATAVELAADGTSTVEVHFVGAPRWLNRVHVLTDSAAFDIEVFDLHKAWQQYGGADEAVSGRPVVTCGPDAKVLGLRFVPQVQEAPGGPVHLFEVEAYFDQVDPDDLDQVSASASDDDYEYFYEWINDYPGSDNDLSNCDDDAEGLADELASDWSSWGYDNDYAWEEDYKRENKSGKNNDYVDTADLGYFVGHGGDRYDDDFDRDHRAAIFANDDYDDENLTPGDGYDCWGDQDLEWMGFSACQMLNENTRSYWASAMNEIHLILGWKTNMKDVDHGRYFGQALVDSGSNDSAKKVKTAWFWAADKLHGSDYTARVLGENSDMGKDYIWGQGTVQDDPEDDREYSYWTYQCSDESSSASVLSDPVVFAPTGDRGLTVVVDQSLLDQFADPCDMAVYNVQPLTVDINFVETMAARICAVSGMFCSPYGSAGYGDPGQINVFDGPWELRVCTNGGAAYIENTETWMELVAPAPNLPSAESAETLAEELLTSWDLFPSDANFETVDNVIEAEVQVDEQGQEIQATETELARRVLYRRYLGEYPVEGPGAFMMAAFGDANEFQRMFRGAWKPAAEASAVSIISLEDVIGALNTSGSDATISGITPMVDQIQVDDARLGYYEYPCHVNQPTLRPAYTLEVTITEVNVPDEPAAVSTDKLHLWADVLPPVGQIDFPPDGHSIVPGEQVCLQGSASGGTPPYTFEWKDSLDGELGSGQSLCTTLSQPNDPYKEITIHTVKLVVKDSQGSQSRAYVGIRTVPEEAWNPDPEHEAEDVAPDANLSWSPGAYAAFHDIYLGTDETAVRDANTVATLGVYKGRQVRDANTYEPPTGLDLETTYYWRIDEVNDACQPEPWKGEVWGFTTTNYLVIDDFESYNNTDNRIRDTWEDGTEIILWSGSYIWLGKKPDHPIHTGSQSMVYQYDNTIKWDWDHYYSEAALPFSPAKDLTYGNLVKALTLYFYGDPGNAAGDTEELYVGLTGSLAEVRYSDAGGDMNDLKLAEWTEWNIPISDFIGVDPCAVTNLLIGFGDRNNTDTAGGYGTVWFDDIRLYRPRCLAQYRPAGDATGDCAVDYWDLKVVAEDWLGGSEVGGDLYVDGIVDFRDWALLSADWLTQAELWPAE
jgi:hypothetical protein